MESKNEFDKFDRTMDDLLRVSPRPDQSRSGSRETEQARPKSR